MGQQKGPEAYRVMAARRKARWIGPVVRNANTRTGWVCLACGRGWQAVYNSLQQGSGCPDCAVRRRTEQSRRRPEDYHALAARRGFRWIGQYPASANSQTEWECPNGHRCTKSYSKLAAGSGCPICARERHRERCARERHTDASYRRAAADAGLEWLGPLPENAHTKTRWRCTHCSRLWVESIHKLLQGRGCPRCRLDRRNDAMRLKPEQYEALGRARGYAWLGPEVRYNSDPTRWRCTRGHEWSASYSCISGGACCHGCQDRVNGMPVSQIQRRLADMLQGEINHRIGRRCIDVALQRNGVRIAAEYDAWFFHGGQQEQDDARDRALIGLGWRILRIRSAYALPSRAEMDAAIEKLVAGAERVVITLPDWGVGPARGIAWERSHPPRPYRRKVRADAVGTGGSVDA